MSNRRTLCGAMLVGIAGMSAGCNLVESFSGDAAIVARAGAFSLPRDTLVAILLQTGTKPDDRRTVQQWAYRWTEFAMLADRLARGDSLLDSATVMEAMWPDANELLVDHWHDELVAQRVSLDSARLDSAYAAGHHRVLQYVFIRTPPDMTPPQREEARRRADRIWRRLLAGGSWEQANEQNEDLTAKAEGGSRGLIERGQMRGPFDSAAFALGPGELSAVVETQFGYQVIRRPLLAEVRTAFEKGIRDVLIARMDSAYLAQLDEESEVSLQRNAAAMMREVAAEPPGDAGSRRVLATYRDGKFREQDLRRWLRALPPATRRNMDGAPDDQLLDLLRSLIRNEVVVRQAKAAGMTLSADDVQMLRASLEEEIRRVRARLGLDSVLAAAPTEEARLAAAESLVRTYFHYLAGRRSGLIQVPPLLADKLRRDMPWKVYGSRVDQVLDLVQAGWPSRPASEFPAVPAAPQRADSSNTTGR